MIVAGYILAALIVAGTLLYLHEQRYRRTHSGRDESAEPASGQPEASTAPVADGSSEAAGDECCGQHLVCEKFHTGNDRLYYEDEELDRYAGRPADSFASAEIEEFRDVLFTLLPADLVGWGLSLQQRGIELPAELRDEYLMLVAENE